MWPTAHEGGGSGINRMITNGKIFRSETPLAYFALCMSSPPTTSMDGRVVLRINVRLKRKIFCVFCVSDVYVRYDPDVREGGGGWLSF